MAKVLTDETALQLTEALLQNDKNIKNTLEKDIHSHDNKSVLDNVTSNKISEWDNKADKSDIPDTKGFVTEYYVATMIANAQLSGGEVDLSGYYNKDETYSKSEVDEVLKNINVDLTGYATEDYVDTAIANAQLEGGEGSNVDLSNYVTKTDLEDYAEKNHEHKEYLTEHQDLSAYALKSDIPSLDDYAKTKDLHTHLNKDILDTITDDKIVSWDAKATEAFVTNAIANAQLGDGGDIKGKNCTIQSIEAVEGGNNVTFAWTLDDGTVKTQTMFVANGEQGPQGPQGETGSDGITPHIGENGNWFIGETDTGVKAGGSGESGGGTGVVIDSIPVGSIVSQMGNTSPKHYLVCDGAEYNIADYPYLAEYFEEQFNMVNIFGGDGITTFAVPKEDTENLKIIASLSAMTSNTAPSPLVASASSTYSDAYPAWKAFDKSAAENSLDAWLSATNTMPQWIMIDCGKPFTCNSVYLAPWNYQSNYETSGPKDFIIQGSNDGESFDDLLSVTDAAWTGNEVEYCTFDIVTYRYYRLYITKISSANWASVTRFDPMLSTPVKRYIKYEPCL